MTRQRWPRVRRGLAAWSEANTGQMITDIYDVA
jgi:hypothetical protein